MILDNTSNSRRGGLSGVCIYSCFASPSSKPSPRPSPLVPLSSPLPFLSAPLLAAAVFNSFLTGSIDARESMLLELS